MCIVSLCFLFVVVEARADFKMPKSVYRMSQIEEAKAEATSKGKAVSFIYTHEKTTCGLCEASSLNAANELKRKTVVVYADSDTESDKLPDAVQTALRTPEAGRFVPKIVIVDSELTNVLAVVPYARVDEQNQLLQKAQKKLPTTHPKSTTLEQKPLAQPSKKGFSILPNDNREVRTWTSRSGATTKGALVHERYSRVVLIKKEDGSKVELMTNLLRQEDQQYLQEIRKQSSTRNDSNISSGS
jgi:hypothetical protein